MRAQSYKGTEIYNQEIGLLIFINSETTTGIKDAVKSEAFLIYPNPAEEYIIIQHPNLEKHTQLFVYDDTGRLIWSQKLTTNTTNIRRSQIARSGKFVYTIAENQQISQSGQVVFK